MIIQRWERYIYREILKLFSLFMVVTFFLYVIIDYSSRGSSLSANLNIEEFIFYYLATFSKELDLFIPFALMITTIRLLCQMNTANEIVTLLAGGISIRRILVPFLVSGFLASTLVVINFETARKSAQVYLKKLRDRDDPTGMRLKSVDRVNNLMVRDDSLLLYQHYDTSRDRFFDVFWIRSFNEVVRIKYLYPHPKHSVGANIDFLVRGNDDRFKRVNSMESQVFEELGFEEEILGIVLNNPENQPISTLWSRLPAWGEESISDKEAQIITAFHFKLAIPLLCFLVVLAPAPYCVRFGRHLHVFMIFGGAIFTFVAFMTVMDAMVVLGENQVFSPASTVWSPMLVGLTYSLIRFMRIRS